MTTSKINRPDKKKFKRRVSRGGRLLSSAFLLAGENPKVMYRVNKGQISNEVIIKIRDFGSMFRTF